MKKAIQFGAGNIGRGFIGAVLEKAGYHVVFADVNEQIVDRINRDKGYTVQIMDTVCEEVRITDISAVDSRSPELAQQIAEAEIVTTAVGLTILPRIAGAIAAGIEARREQGVEQPLNVIACENGVRATSQLKAAVLTHLDAAGQAYCEQYVGFPDCSVDRIVPPVKSENPIDVVVERFFEWNVERAAFKGAVPEIPGMNPADNLIAYIERKLFTLNTGHAITAYLGRMKGYMTICQSISDEQIHAVVKAAMRESGRGLVARYGFDRDAHFAYIDKIIGRFTNPYLCDDVTRVGREPLRKLSAGDRLETGPHGPSVRHRHAQPATGHRCGPALRQSGGPAERGDDRHDRTARRGGGRSRNRGTARRRSAARARRAGVRRSRTNHPLIPACDMKNTKLLLLAACCAAIMPACAQAPRLHTVKINSIEELQVYFTYDPARDVIVSGHRGGMMPGYPENCIESCEKTLSLMPTFFEIDFSFTKDSVMVLMHDLTIDRTTTGKGLVADYTYDELRRLNLVDRDGKVTPYRIPRLKDVLEWGKDKVVFNFDNKYINTKGVSDEVRRASLDYYIRQLRPGGEWSMYHNIMLSVRSIEEALYYWNHGIRNVMFCVEISSMEHFRAYDASPIPWKYIMAYIRLAVNPELQQVYDLLHAEGVMTMTSITGSSDKVKNPHDRRVAYMRELLAEPDIIETDYPSEFIGLPWSRDAIHALQDAAIRGNRSSTDLK